METVGFTRMKDGTREDYELLGRIELDYIYGSRTGSWRTSNWRKMHSAATR